MAAKLYNTREEKLAARKLSYQRRREQILAYAAKYRAENKEKIKAATAEKNVGYVRRYRERHPERMRASSRAWKANNPERHKATCAEWSANNLEKHRTYQHNRRGLKSACGGKLSPDLAERLLALQKGKCACCGKSLASGYDMDHIVPLSKGGRNVDSNMQLLTPSCNRSKGAQDPIAFMQEKRGMLL